jgi:pimeloyl-ACP methyl ester carboxylesterase
MKNGFIQVGNGPHHVIALSGWMGGSDGWGTMFDAIDRNLFTFVLVDYRGYGLSRERKDGYSFTQAARDVIELADDLGWDRFSLMGHSMGGVAIQRVLLEAPDRIQKLVGISPVPACSSRMDEQRLGFFMGGVADVAIREKVFGVSTGGQLSPVWTQAMAKASMESVEPEAFGAYLREWATVDFSEKVIGQPHPVKVFVGQNDPTLSAALMEQTWLKYYPNSSCEVLANAGHYAMFETPLALGTKVAAFLSE